MSPGRRRYRCLKGGVQNEDEFQVMLSIDRSITTRFMSSPYEMSNERKKQVKQKKNTSPSQSPHTDLATCVAVALTLPNSTACPFVSSFKAPRAMLNPASV